MYILGISAYYHDSAAVIIKDGKIVVAAEEERFSRIKHDNGFPYKAIKFCLKYEKININQINYIAFYEKPLLKFERILINFIETFPRSLSMFKNSIPEWIGEKIKVKYTIQKKLKFSGRIFFIPHHLSHASATYHTSSFGKSAVLTIDGVGEYQTTALWLAIKNKIKLIKYLDFPNSLGLLYSTFTAFCGFEVNEGEYKLMGMAAYGEPKYVKDIYKIIDIKDDGSFRLNMSYFGFQSGNRMWNSKFETLFGEPRLHGGKNSKKHKDIASSIQNVTEEIYIKMANHLSKISNSNNLCVGGGVGLNSLANGKLYSQTKFKKIHIFGPAGDSGGSIGAALYTYHSILNKPRLSKTPLLSFGSEYTNNQIKKTLKAYNLKYIKFDNQIDLINESANLLAKNKILGWFQGRMEFGPRALGNRSILASPKDKSMKDKVNKIKFREQFRPFAGMIIQENIDELFIVPEKRHHSPYMNFCFFVKPEAEKKISAIVHHDKTCRIQTVDKTIIRPYLLLKEFYKLTGIPVLLNTSFNIKDEPIVENPEQAVEDFLNTLMDYLIIGDFIVSRTSHN